MLETEIVKYGEIGVIVFLVSILFWIIKKGFTLYDSLGESIRANTEVTKASHEYLKLRNGSLEKSNELVTKTLDSVCSRLNNIK